MALGVEGKPLPLAGLIDIGLGEILLERNLLEEASDYLERGCHSLQSIWYLGNLDGLVSLARLRQAQGNNSAAQAIIEEAACLALTAEAAEWDMALVAATAVRLALQHDDMATAEQWWYKARFPDLNKPIALEQYPYHIYEYLLLTQARFLIARGQETGMASDLNQAAEFLEMLLSEANKFQRMRSQIEILVQQARAQHALGDQGAIKTLLRALALGEPEGYRQIFLDEGWQLAGLLCRCRSASQFLGSHLPSISFIDSLLGAIQNASSLQQASVQHNKPQVRQATAYLEYGLPVSLSAREVEVLSLIADGKTNQQISAQLYLALNTVKRHAYNIYAKLEVGKRTQAVSKARQLGLIL
jgi:LuxR family maltose regulon positive regulatory protein